MVGVTINRHAEGEQTAIPKPGLTAKVAPGSQLRQLSHNSALFTSCYRLQVPVACTTSTPSPMKDSRNASPKQAEMKRAARQGSRPGHRSAGNGKKTK